MGEYGLRGGEKCIAPKHVIVSQFAIGGNSLYCNPTPVVYRVYFVQDFFNVISCRQIVQGGSIKLYRVVL